MLTGEPPYAALRDYLYGPFDPLTVNVGNTRQDLANLFSDFVEWLPSSTLLSVDGHFMPQTQLLDGAPSDTQILDVRHLDQHLDRLAPPLANGTETRRRNVTQDLVDGPFMSQDTYVSVTRLYEDDFARWGDHFYWTYQSAWDTALPATASLVSQAFVERARAARRLTNILNQMDILRSERDVALAELGSILASRTWRWTSGWRQLRTRSTSSRL